MSGQQHGWREGLLALVGVCSLLSCDLKPSNQARAKMQPSAVATNSETIAQAVSRYDLTIEQVVEWYRVVGQLDSVATISGQRISLLFPLSSRLSDQVRKVEDTKGVSDIVMANGMTIEEFIVRTATIQIVRITMSQHDSLGEAGLFKNVGPGALRFGIQYRAVFDSLDRAWQLRKSRD